jgi:hypothetical protein
MLMQRMKERERKRGGGVIRNARKMKNRKMANIK